MFDVPDLAPFGVEPSKPPFPTPTSANPHVPRAELPPAGTILQVPSHYLAHKPKPRHWNSVSGLAPWHVKQAVNMTLHAAILTYKNASAAHYTEGALRWEGIDSNRKAWRGEFPRYSDCSAFCTWCLWNGLSHFHHSDNVNGQHWWGGYTGTLLSHGRRVRSLAPGDLVIYGRWFPGEHVAIYTGGGLVVSQGQEDGPHLMPYWQMGMPILSFRRYI